MLLIALALPLVADDSILGTVEKICVGSMGQSDEAERFRILLESELTNVGFTSVAAGKADAILSGAMSVRVYADRSVARATLVLKTPDGTQLWSKDFQPHLHFGGKDSVKLRAQDVAKSLRKDVTSAQKHK